MAKRKNYFLPYMRQGLATQAAASNLTGKRTKIPVKLNLAAIDKKNNQGIGAEVLVEKDIVLFGAGDVLGINEQVIAKVAPPANINNFEASLTPFIEFSEPDFLWRFSMRNEGTEADRKWIPWLALLVLKVGDAEEAAEFSLIKNENPDLPPRIQLKPNAVLPDLKESWRWAHVHLLEREGQTTSQIIDTIKRSPQKAVCRLLSPRRLKPQTKYQAFVVPAYRIGLEAALQLPNGTEDGSLLSWKTPEQGLGDIGNQLPYYYQWAFTTGTKGDFEFLVEKLKPRDLANLGTRTVDCSNPGYGLTPSISEMEMEAPLMSLDVGTEEKPLETFPKETQKKLVTLLNSRRDEEKKVWRVTPPVYGEWYAQKENETKKLKKSNKDHWLEELNLDFRHRAAAGLGTQFIKEQQEALMKAAWTQLDKVQKVNKTLNLGRFGRALSTKMHQRLEKIAPEKLLKIVLPLKDKIVVEESNDNGLENFNPTQQRMGTFLQQTGLVNTLMQVKVKKYLPKKTVTKDKTSTSFLFVHNTQLINQNFQMQYLDINTPPKEEEEQEQEADVSYFKNLGKQITPKINPQKTIETKIVHRIRAFRRIEEQQQLRNDSGLESGNRNVNAQDQDPLRPVKWYPEFHQAMYRFLRDLSQEYILPGLENVPPDTIGLLKTNRRFIEAFMIGLNHEFASELRWREFPTDMRGNYFRSFWDTSIYSVDDSEKVLFKFSPIGQKLVQVVHQRYGEDYNTFEKIAATYTLGAPSEIEQAVANAYESAIERWLLTREEDKDIEKPSDWQAHLNLGKHPIASKANEADNLVLLIRGELLQKFSNALIYLVGRKPNDDTQPDLSENAKRTFPIFEGALPPDLVFIGFNIKPEEAAQYFIIFEERMTDLRFGLDIKADVGDTSINALSWEHFEGLQEGSYLDGQIPTILTDDWKNAAFIGKAMVQKQVRVAVKLEEMLP